MTTKTETSKKQKVEPQAKNPAMIPKHRDRKNYLLALSGLPVLICVIAFARSAVYRVTYKPEECKSFGWYSSSSGEFQCDYKPLDLHATFALAWLALFATQVCLLAFGKPAWHRRVGRIGLLIAFSNAAGMLWLAFQDTVNPMERTDRPPDFTPFMFLVAFKLTACLILSVWCIYSKERDVEGHMLWMFRGFITSFTTPVIRFYPLVLRLVAGDECFDEHRDKFVMGAMFVAEATCVLMYTMAQRKTQPVFWDTFMKLQMVTMVFATLKELRFASTHGLFIKGMMECALGKKY